MILSFKKILKINLTSTRTKEWLIINAKIAHGINRNSILNVNQNIKIRTTVTHISREIFS